jgi:hypothetical protein
MELTDSQLETLIECLDCCLETQLPNSARQQINELREKFMKLQQDFEGGLETLVVSLDLLREPFSVAPFGKRID